MSPETLLSRRSALLALASVTATKVFALDSHADLFPQFTARTLSGERLTNESLKGKPALFQFWATWCPYCKGDMPAVEKIVQEFAGRLVVVGVDVGESRQKVAKFLAQTPRSCKIVLTEDTNLAAMFAPKAFPLYVLMDQDGRIAGVQRGAGGEKALRQLLRNVKLG